MITSLQKYIAKRYPPFTPLTTNILQPACLICQLPQSQPSGFCQQCQEELPWQPPGCRLCQDQVGDFSNGLCLSCIQSTPDFAICRAALNYHGPVPGLIHQAKESGNFATLYSLAKTLSDALCTHYSGTPQQPEALLPVPIQASRLGQRGFNQSLEVCKVIRRHLAIPILSGCIVRRTGLAPQKTLNRQQRLDNEGKMFTAINAGKLTCFRHIAIIDDVITTSSTVRELATLVKHQAKVPQIDVWAIARRNSPDSQ